MRSPSSVLLIALVSVLGSLAPARAQDCAADPAQKKEEPAAATSAAGAPSVDGAKEAEGAESAAAEPAADGGGTVDGVPVTETIEVVGYRHALEESVTLKRDAV